MQPRDQIVLTPATGVADKTQKSLSLLYGATNDWIKTNTNADIEYLTRVVVATPTNTRASNELNITLPSTTSELSLLTDYPIDPTEDTKIVNNTSIDRATKWKMAICKKYANQVYWKSLDAPGKNKADYCKEKNLIAFVDYRGIGSSTVDKNLYFRDSTGGLTEVSGVDFGWKYNLSSAQQAAIKWKTMTFDFTPNTVTCGTANQYLFYANSNGTNYQKYYPSNTSTQWCVQSIPPWDTTWDQKFPKVSEFQIGYASVNQGTKQPMYPLNTAWKLLITQ